MSQSDRRNLQIQSANRDFTFQILIPLERILFEIEDGHGTVGRQMPAQSVISIKLFRLRSSARDIGQPASRLLFIRDDRRHRDFGDRQLQATNQDRTFAARRPLQHAEVISVEHEHWNAFWCHEPSDATTHDTRGRVSSLRQTPLCLPVCFRRSPPLFSNPALRAAAGASPVRQLASPVRRDAVSLSWLLLSSRQPCGPPRDSGAC